MRDLTKSMLRVPWVVSIFSIQQIARSVVPRDGVQKSMSEVDEVSAVLEDKLGETASGLYRTGKQVQDGMVNAVFDLTSGSWSSTEQALGQAWRAIDQGWSKVQRVTDPRRGSR